MMKKQADAPVDQQPQDLGQPAVVAATTAYAGLSEALVGWYDKPLHQLPAELQWRVRTEFEKPPHQLPAELRRSVSTESSGSLWDSITEDRRRSWCQETDRQRLWDEACVDWIYWQKLKTLTAQEFCSLRHVLDPRKFEAERDQIPGGEGKTLCELVSDDVKVIERSLGLDAKKAVQEWVLLAQQQGWGIPSYLRAPADEGSDIGPDQGALGNHCAVFRAMHNLTADEVTFTFVGDKTESGLGANNMLEISARGKTKRVALAALDLVDRRRGRLNSQGIILLGMAHGDRLIRTENKAQGMSRLRRVFRTHLGINTDPFYPYRRGAGWQATFKICDERGAANERAKREAERRTVSYDDNKQRHQSFDSKGDAADEWLKANDRDRPA